MCKISQVPQAVRTGEGFRLDCPDSLRLSLGLEGTDSFPLFSTPLGMAGAQWSKHPVICPCLALRSRARQWHPTPVLLPGKSHGRRSLVGCSPWGREELDTTERLHFHFSLSCIGEGNGKPLQCSCLENPRDGEPGGLPSMGLHRVGHD